MPSSPCFGQKKLVWLRDLLVCSPYSFWAVIGMTIIVVLCTSTLYRTKVHIYPTDPFFTPYVVLCTSTLYLVTTSISRCHRNIHPPFPPQTGKTPEDSGASTKWALRKLPDLLRVFQKHFLFPSGDFPASRPVVSCVVCPPRCAP